MGQKMAGIKLEILSRVGNQIRKGGNRILFVQRVSAIQAEALRRLGFLVIIPE